RMSTPRLMAKPVKACKASSHVPIPDPAHPPVGAPPDHHLGDPLHDPPAAARETLGPPPPPPQPDRRGAGPHPPLLRLGQAGLVPVRALDLEPGPPRLRNQLLQPPGNPRPRQAAAPE